MTEKDQSVLRRVLRRSITLTVTLAIFSGAAAAVLAGLSLISTETDMASRSISPLTSVGVMQVQFTQGYTVIRRFTGQVEAAARTDLGFELGGRITQILVEEGDLVTSGSVLARLDTRALIPERAALEAELEMLEAENNLARLTLNRNNLLTERGLRSVAAQDEALLALTRAEAGKAAIRARIAGVDVQLDKSVLTAPFDARIGSRLADPGQTTAAGQPVLVLFDAAPARARVGLPPSLASSLSAGDTLAVDIAGALYPSRILQIRPDLDPSTRSRSIVLELPPDSAPVLGDTMTLMLTQNVYETGFWVPITALREGARGSWAVMALESTMDGNRTRLMAVEVIHSESARVFLRGQLPEGSLIVAQAPDRVAPGQNVVAKFTSVWQESW